ncbi:MAG: hypothetical protein MZV70_30325 [Desulfobacterales bacterium]|nr:hypothetical protein [Desulfobacterales bacterium]
MKPEVPECSEDLILRIAAAGKKVGCAGAVAATESRNTARRPRSCASRHSSRSSVTA